MPGQKLQDHDMDNSDKILCIIVVCLILWEMLLLHHGLQQSIRGDARGVRCLSICHTAKGSGYFLDRGLSGKVSNSWEGQMRSRAVVS
eukprot:13153671-Ditylum_brightwellii.AAC.1